MAVDIPYLMRKHRENERYSQEAMASFLNVSQATYHNWESGKSPIAFRHYPKIAQICNIPVTELLPPEFGVSF